MNPEPEDYRLDEVREVISSTMGLLFPKERWDILRRNLASAAQGFGFKHFDEFVQWLLTASLNSDQIEQLACYLTVNETYFWREPQVFSALTDFILPELVEQKKMSDRKIRIWSAGCSSGEEAYSLAIALKIAIPNIREWNVKILATDINQTVLNKAKAGLYRQWSFRNCPPWLKSNYFDFRGDGVYEIIPEIRKMVSFANLNLVGDSFPSQKNDTRDFDLIFCRNVLMYLTPQWIGKISSQFFNALQKDGWFAVSSCELSQELFAQFKPVNFNGAVLYRKGNKNFTPSVLEPETVTVHHIPFPVATNLPVIEWTGLLNSNPENIPPPEPEKKAEVTAITAPAESAPETALKIRILANQGHLYEALSICDEAIAADKLSVEFYFLRASILQEFDKSSEAIASLKQAIYLDPKFIMAHFTLGNLYIQNGKPKNAKIAFNNVLDLLSTRSDEEILPDSEGLSVQYIREIILSSMQKISNS